MAWRTYIEGAISPDIVTSRRVYYESLYEGNGFQTYRYAKRHVVTVSEYRGYDYASAVAIANVLESESTGSIRISNDAQIQSMSGGGYNVINTRDEEEANWKYIRD